MRVQSSIRIDAPRERVWELVSNPRNYERFMEGARFWHLEGEPDTGPRARYTLRMRVRSAEIGGVVEVIEWDPPHELAWTSLTGIDQRGRWILHRDGSGTEVIFRLGYHAPGGLMALLADRIAAPFVRRNVAGSLASLKRLIEQGGA